MKTSNTMQTLPTPTHLDIALPTPDESNTEVLRECINDATQTLYALFDAGTDIIKLVHMRSDFVDHILKHIWQLHFAKTNTSDIALIAVGGYGRGELHPASDIDIMILLREDCPQHYKNAIEKFITFLWDTGLDVGHSVRSIEQCLIDAKKDITIATNIMESRLIIGPQDLHQTLRKIAGPDYIWPSKKFFEAKWKEQKQRHLRFHDTAYKLEPNVKESPGGLRDIQMVGWVAKRHFGADKLEDLVAQGFLTPTDLQSLEKGQAFLWQVRFALHKLSGRREDRLLFDYQRTLARQFNYQDEQTQNQSNITESSRNRPSDGHRLGVELFMKKYYRTIMELSRLNEILLQLYQEVILYNHGVIDPIPINRRFQTRKGFIEVTNEYTFKRYPFALLEVFLLLAENPHIKGVRASTIRLIRSHRYLINNDFRKDLRCRSLFLEILRQPSGITHELRRMNRYGILAAYIPAFGSIVGQMQFDLFHVYTVDEHSLFVVRNLRRFTVAKYHHEFPLCSKIIQHIPKPELLYIAGLFHDIAKGRGGDHSVLGAEEVTQFCQLHCLSQTDTELVAWLVRHHLLMSSTAQHKDTSDPEVIYSFASIVEDHTRLDYLYLLTVADMRATNNTLWNNWKDALLIELYKQTQRALKQDLESPIDKRAKIHDEKSTARKILNKEHVPIDEVNQLWSTMDDEYFLRYNAEEIAWHTQGILKSAKKNTTQPLIMVQNSQAKCVTNIFICTPISSWLFANITAEIDRLNLNIVEARISTAKKFGYALDTFSILDENGQPITSPHRIAQIKKSIGHQIIKNTPPTLPQSRHQARIAKVFSRPTEVHFATDEKNQRTVMEITSTDRPGLLSRVAYALVECNIILQNAKITTYGAQVDDVFFITDENSQPILDIEKRNHIREAICCYLDTIK